jgi:hypothetical protein
MSSEESPEVCGSTQTGSELGVKILITCSCDEDLQGVGVADAGMHDSCSGVPRAATRALAGACLRRGLVPPHTQVDDSHISQHSLATAERQCPRKLVRVCHSALGHSAASCLQADWGRRALQ